MSVFICYRRDDAEREARALYTTLAEETDESNLFLDHDAIGVGENWRARIDETLKKVRAVLVVIGPAWFEHLERRLKDGTTDTVRAEIAASLAQLNVQGIPITVKGARLPSGSSLPSDISALTDRNAIEVRGSAWRDDTNRLIKTLRREGALPISRRMWRLRGAAVIGVVAIVGTIAAMLTRVPTIPTSMSPRYAKQLVETGGLHFKELRVQRGQFQGNIVETAARGIPVAVGQRPAPGQVRLRGQTVEVDFILGRPTVSSAKGEAS